MDLKVVVYRRPNMFNVNDNLYNMLGLQELKNLFSIEDYKTDHEKLILFFPERFLNILEQLVLISRIEKAGYSEVNITTHSVYIIQTCPHEKCFIVDDETIKEGSQFKLSNDKVGLPDDSFIQSL